MKKVLKDKGVEDSTILAQLDEIENATKETAGPSTPALSHKSLNQLQKAEKSSEAVKKQFTDLDTQRQAWQDCMMKKFEE